MTTHPLRSRYTGKDMQHIFSDERKFTGWRDCWIALAESQNELGLEQVRPEYITALKQFYNDIPHGRAEQLERELRHDVMAHIKAFGEQVEQVQPGAGGIIHLGATSMYPCDNTELLQIREGLDVIIGKTINVFRKMKPFAEEHLRTPCLAKTHYQPAQPTTYGKRITDWMHNLTIAFDRTVYERNSLKGRGVKGTTGTQDSFLKLFNGDHEKVEQLDKLVTQKLGFRGAYPITTQTYPRIVDYHVLSAIAGISVASKKITTDIRLLQGEGEVAEPFRDSQVGSSAMAYKRNPMRSERSAGLARHVFTGPLEAMMYASEQWLERSLDDSAERRIVIPDTFLGVDASLNLLLDIFSQDKEGQKGFSIYPAVAEKNLQEHMPFLATEAIMMQAVKDGADRQEVHEAVRKASPVARSIIDNGGDNEILRILGESMTVKVTNDTLNPLRYIGRAPELAQEFLTETIDPLLEQYDHIPEIEGGVKV